MQLDLVPTCYPYSATSLGTPTFDPDTERSNGPWDSEVQLESGRRQDRQAVFANGTAVLFEDGDSVLVVTGEVSIRFLLVAGKPLGEPVAWRGPIVMNTQKELDTAFAEYARGDFIR